MLPEDKESVMALYRARIESLKYTATYYSKSNRPIPLAQLRRKLMEKLETLEDRLWFIREMRRLHPHCRLPEVRVVTEEAIGSASTTAQLQLLSALISPQSVVRNELSMQLLSMRRQEGQKVHEPA